MKDSSDISVHYSPFESSTFTFTNNQFKRQVETNLGDPEEVSEVEKTNVEEKETENYKSGSEQGSLRKPKSPKHQQQEQGRRKKHQKRQNSKRPQPNEHQFGTFEPAFEFESLKAYTAYD